MDYILRVFNDEVFGVKSALRRAKYPMLTEVPDFDFPAIDDLTSARGEAISMKNTDINRGIRLGNSPYGHGDDKFLRQIYVGMDITAPRFWWQEFATYGFHVGNSQSTMHKAAKIDFRKICNPYVDSRMMDIFEDILREYIENPTVENLERFKSNMPEGIMLTTGITTNYGQLKTIYYQRRNHKLPEWHVFCDWIETLPYAKEFGVCGKYEG